MRYNQGHNNLNSPNQKNYRFKYFTSKPVWIILEVGLILLAMILIDCRTLSLNYLNMKIYFATKLLNRLALLILILSFFQLMNRSFIETLGFKNLRIRREIAIGILVGLVLILVTIGFGVLSEKVDFLKTDDSNDAEFITSNMDTPWHLGAWILLGILAGGIMEEIVRIYLFLRIETVTNSGIALVSTSFLFGLGHWYRTGFSSFLITFFVAMMLTIFFIKRNRKIIAPISAHACGDTIGMIMSYISVHYGLGL